MRKGRLAALLASLLMLALVLGGCGGAAAGGGGGTDAKAAFVGTWDLMEMEDDDEVTSEDDIELMRSFGLDVYLQLDEDGTGSLVLFGEEMDATWTASTTSEGSITIDGQTVDMTIADGKLTMMQDGAKLTFTKGDARDNSNDATTDVDDEDEAVEDPIAFDEAITLADDDTCTIVATGKEDYYGDPAIVLSVINKTDRDIFLTTGDFTVDGKEVDGIIGETVDAGETDDDVKLWFEADELGSKSITALTNVVGEIEVSDDDTLDTIATYNVTIS